VNEPVTVDKIDSRTGGRLVGCSRNGSQDEFDAFADGVLEALYQAAKQAHFDAYQAGTGVVYCRDGMWGLYPPDPAMYEDMIPPPFQEGQQLPEPTLPR
jgi:hypothetical protein